LNKTELFELSLKMILELKQEIIKSEVYDCGPRLDLAEQCIYISFEHGIAVNTLLTTELATQAMILLRAQFEAVVRAYWILFIASNHQITKLTFGYTLEEQFESDTCPMVSEMLEKLSSGNLEAKPVIEHLFNFKKYHLKQLNSFVHTGKQSFTRDVMGYAEDMLLIMMKQSNNLITGAAQLMLKHTVPDKQKFIHHLIEKYRECFYLDQDVDENLRRRVDGYFR
jgi:hypothetical protein